MPTASTPASKHFSTSRTTSFGSTGPAIEQPSAIEIAAPMIGLCALAARRSHLRLTFAIARAVGIGLAVLFGRRNHRRDFGHARGQRLVDAALVQRQRDAMRTWQRG